MKMPKDLQEAMEMAKQRYLGKRINNSIFWDTASSIGAAIKDIATVKIEDVLIPFLLDLAAKAPHSPPDQEEDMHMPIVGDILEATNWIQLPDSGDPPAVIPPGSKFIVQKVDPDKDGWAWIQAPWMRTSTDKGVDPVKISIRSLDGSWKRIGTASDLLENLKPGTVVLAKKDLVNDRGWKVPAGTKGKIDSSDTNCLYRTYHVVFDAAAKVDGSDHTDVILGFDGLYLLENTERFEFKLKKGDHVIVGEDHVHTVDYNQDEYFPTDAVLEIREQTWAEHEDGTGTYPCYKVFGTVRTENGALAKNSQRVVWARAFEANTAEWIKGAEVVPAFKTGDRLTAQAAVVLPGNHPDYWVLGNDKVKVRSVDRHDPLQCYELEVTPRNKRTGKEGYKACYWFSYSTVEKWFKKAPENLKLKFQEGDLVVFKKNFEVIESYNNDLAKLPISFKGGMVGKVIAAETNREKLENAYWSGEATTQRVEVEPGVFECYLVQTYEGAAWLRQRDLEGGGLARPFDPESDPTKVATAAKSAMGNLVFVMEQTKNS